MATIEGCVISDIKCPWPCTQQTLMCAGGRDKKNPAQICAYLKYKSGWITQLISSERDFLLEMEAFKNQAYLYRRNISEYFILENRYAYGRDGSLPSSGLAVWHVDELGSNNWEQMEPLKHYECSLEQSDGRFDLEKYEDIGDEADLYPNGQNISFTSSTIPSSNWWDGSLSGLEIADISPPGQKISFRVIKK